MDFTGLPHDIDILNQSSLHQQMRSFHVDSVFAVGNPPKFLTPELADLGDISFRVKQRKVGYLRRIHTKAIEPGAFVVDLRIGQVIVEQIR